MSKREEIERAARGRSGECHNYLDDDSAASPMEVMTEEQFQLSVQEGIKSALLVALASMLESDGFVPESIQFIADDKRENLEIKIVGTIMVSKDELALVLGQPTSQADAATAQDGDQPESE